MKRYLDVFSAVCLLAWASTALAAPSPPRLGAPPIRFHNLSNEDGLSQATVYAILQDRQGFLWFGTQSGLNRFDGLSFRVFKNDPKDPSSLAPQFIKDLREGPDGRLWIATHGGLNLFDPVTERFTLYTHDDADPHSLAGNRLETLLMDGPHTLWIGTDQGLDRFDPATGRSVRYQHDPDRPTSIRDNFVNTITKDRSGQLWVGTRSGLEHFDPVTGHFSHQLEGDIQAILEDTVGNLWVGTLSKGLFRRDPASGSFVHYAVDPTDPTGLASSRIMALLEDDSATLWVGTDGGGLHRLDPASATFWHYQHDPRDPYSLRGNVIYTLFEDRSGNIWVGNWAQGIHRFNPRLEPFTRYAHDPTDPGSLGGSNVRAIAEDLSGTLWVGVWGQGIYRLDQESGKFRHYQADPNDPGSLISDTVYTFYVDRAGALWIGTFEGISRFDPARETFTGYRHDSTDPTSLGKGRVRDFLEDRRGNVWIASDEGIDVFDPETRRFSHFRHEADNPDSLGDDDVLTLYNDRAGNLWVGTRKGIDRLDRSRNAFVHYPSCGRSPVWDFYEDRSGTLWAATGGSGLCRFDHETGNLTSYAEEAGLPDHVVYNILEDDLGRLWLSTNLGLARFDPRTGKVMNYDTQDGLQGLEFNFNAACRGADGTMYFGGVQGLTAFRPERLLDAPAPSPVVLTSFRIFQQETDLDRAIGYLDKVELSHRDNFFSFEFAALSFHRADKSRYSYMLEEFDDDWIETDGRRFAGYTGVPPGEYVFRVKAANRDGVWNNEGAALRVVIRPPWWATWWAYALYTVIMVTSLVTFVDFQRRKVDRERVVNRRLRELDKLKDEFLANTSHELRTPLYGITGLAESLIDGARGEVAPGVKSDLSMIVHSGRRLSHLVGDILDFSKLRHKRLEISPRPVDLRPLVEVVLTLSRPLVGSKELELVNSVPADLPAVAADENRLQQIMHNLMGNAVKFTRSGRVEVSAAVEGERVIVRVTDTGVGIPAEKRERIFDSFEQADASTEREYGGTGLGLAVTRQLVELHRGEIWIESNLGEGSVFSFTLPVAEAASETDGLKAATSRPAVLVAPVPADEMPTALPTVATQAATDAARILAVDDDPINLQVLRNYLTVERFHLTLASSGEEALRLLGKESFDLVLLDIMMPRLSGYEVCRALREKHPIAQLPVIFLTAKSQDTDIVTGMALGANDYLTKPISKDRLLARVRPHLDLLHIHRKLEALVEEKTSQVKVLNGLLPICGGCKKIRDDEGYWNQLETFIDSHSEATFSHSICPDCADRYYAGYQEES